MTYFLVNITWVFFRARDFGAAKLLLLSMFGVIEGGAQVLPTLEIVKVVVVITGLVITHWLTAPSRSRPPPSVCPAGPTAWSGAACWCCSA